jgi:hypothetical protein
MSTKTFAPKIEKKTLFLSLQDVPSALFIVATVAVLLCLG